MELVIFDMDGTIIEFNLPIEEIKRKIGVQKRILEEILRSERREELLKVLESYEIEAAKNSKLYPHFKDFLRFLEENYVVTALYTRNSRKSVEIVLEKHDISFDYVFTREKDLKPSPKPIIKLMEKKGLKREDAVMIGDFYFDYLTAKNCGIPFWMMLNSRNETFLKEYEIKPDLIFRNYRELLSGLKL